MEVFLCLLISLGFINPNISTMRITVYTIITYLHIYKSNKPLFQD